MRYTKKAYFFLLDSLIALAILGVGFLIFFFVNSEVPENEQVSFYSADIMQFLSDTKIIDVNNPYSGLGGELWNQGLITNEEHSLLQQAAFFYATGNDDIAGEFIDSLAGNRIPSQFLFELWIDDELIFPSSPSLEHQESKTNTELLLTSKKIVYGFLDENNGQLFGPYIAEVFVWRSP